MMLELHDPFLPGTDGRVQVERSSKPISVVRVDDVRATRRASRLMGLECSNQITLILSSGPECTNGTSHEA